MSKFIKRLRKKIKFPNYILCLFEPPNDFSSLVESFPNVFCFCFKDKSLRSKNVIYVDDIKHLLSILTIEMLFVKDQHKERLNDLRVLLANRRPLVFLEKNSDVTRDDVNFFQKFKFSYIEPLDDYSVWRYQQ